MCDLGRCARRGATTAKLEDGDTLTVCVLHATMLGEAGADVQLSYETLMSGSKADADEARAWLCEVSA